jgi:hypothetical protein
VITINGAMPLVWMSVQLSPVRCAQYAPSSSPSGLLSSCLSAATFQWSLGGQCRVLWPVTQQGSSVARMLGRDTPTLSRDCF